MKLIAAVDERWALGRDGKLLFSIPEDLAQFRELTTGHVIVYGSRTMQTFPGGRPLPNRKNIVLTHAPETVMPPAVGCDCVEKAAALAGADGFVVGGASVYRQLLPRCDTAYITKVLADGAGDCFLPDLDAVPEWQCVFTSGQKTWNGLQYRFLRYERRK